MYFGNKLKSNLVKSFPSENLLDFVSTFKLYIVFLFLMRLLILFVPKGLSSYSV